MWTANITKKVIEQGKLRIFVDYSNGTESVTDSFFARSLAEVENSITHKLNDLENVEILMGSLPDGRFTPPVSTPAVDEKGSLLLEISRLQNLVSLGVLEKTDSELVAKISAYKLL